MVINIRQGTAEDNGFIIKDKVHITRRELETLALIGMGFSNIEAARKMSVSINTVRNHIWNLMQKIGAENRAHAIVLAVQNGIFNIQHKRSLDTRIRGTEYYVLCIYCGKASSNYDYSEETTKEVQINHVKYQMPVLPKCPTEGCNGEITETIYWGEVRKHHPEYPEIPELGVKYDYDISWYLDNNLDEE